MKDWWQDRLVVAMEGWLGMCWTSGLVLDERKDIVWQCGLEFCRSDNDQGTVWEVVFIAEKANNGEDVGYS